tara:strand:- start:188 stop:460 length:273 start_codon:yes stop_codon:yes gene_type:complete
LSKKWEEMSDVEKWEHCVDKWEREKWSMLRKYLTPQQLEAVKNVDSIARKMRWGLRKELENEQTLALCKIAEESYEAGYNDSTEDEYYAD